MAIIYPKTTVWGTRNALVLNPREALIYPFDIGDWTRIRYGYVMSATPTGDPAYNGYMGADATPYVVNRSGPYSEIYLGLKRDGTGFAGTDGDYFVGLRDPSGLSSCWQLHASLWSAQTYGVTHKNGTRTDLGTYYSSFPSWGSTTFPTGTNSYSVFYAFELEVLNKGLSNQQIAIKSYNSAAHDFSVTWEPNKDNVYTRLIQGSFGGSLNSSSGILPFNVGGVPYDLPNAFFFYQPSVNCQFKFYNFAVIKDW